VDPAVEFALPRPERVAGRSLLRAGIAVYALGALYDLYTTKRALDAGLREGNPLLRGSGDPGRTLARGAVAKFGFAFVVGTVGRRGQTGTRARATVFFACGAIQLGLGIANRNATVREREAFSTLPPPDTIPPALQPLRPNKLLELKAARE
jgi:hypothetical protein